MFKSVLWDVGGKVLNQLIAFGVSVVLARILTPDDFGIAAIGLVFVSYSSMFLDLGFRNSLVYKQDCSDKLYSTVLFVNFAGALLLSFIFLACSGLIANFYHEPAIRKVIQLVTLLFLATSLTLVPNAVNSKELKFKSLSLISILASIVSGGLAIWMALHGWGLYSIIYRYLISAILVCVFNWVICSWRFSFGIDLKSIREIWPHSSKFFITSMLEGFFLKLDVLVIGRVFNSTTLGYYTRAQSLDNITRELTMGTMYSVFLPYFSRIQNDIRQVLEVYTRCLEVISFSLLLLSGMLILNANDIFIMFFTAKWLPAAPLFQILSILGYFFTLNVVSNILLCGVGKVKEYLRVELVKKSMIILAFLAGIFAGTLIIFLFLLLTAYVVGLFLNFSVVSKTVGGSLKTQLLAILKYFIPALVVIVVCGFIFSHLQLPLFYNILVRSVSYAALFIGINILMKNPAIAFFKQKAGHYYRLYFRLRQPRSISG
jgi:teichuronic acid exporter